MVNTITFGGVTSSTYDIYISGEGVWSAPARDAETVTIPGRNGAFVHDKGRFENIEVTYPAFIVKDNNTNFTTKIDGFRNALASQVGYQKLVDTFHTDEYRMAAFIGGLEVKPILYNDHAATFDITFTCKPQRFLTTGDTAVTVANNGTITNPTLFDSHPLLAVKGNGTVTMNGFPIVLNNVGIGTITLNEGGQGWVAYGYDDSLINNNDPLYMSSAKAVISYTFSDPIKSVTVNPGDVSVTKSNADLYMSGYSTQRVGTRGVDFNFSLFQMSFLAGTSATIEIKMNPVTITYTDDSSDTYQIGFRLVYNPLSDPQFIGNRNINGSYSYNIYDAGTITADSSISALGNPTYIDCDIGEAYKIVNDNYVSLDNAVEIGSSLPVLSSGSNTVTYENTITEVKITPRWWKI